MWKNYRKNLWFTLAGGSVLFLMEPWWDLGSWPWAIVFFLFTGLGVWEDRARVGQMVGEPKGDEGSTDRFDMI